MSAPPGARKRVVILGGGAAGVTTAFQLTSDPRWREQYDSITIYQQGWRLGGKCASGRVVSDTGKESEGDGRIEEHGLHILMGWYVNSFQMIDQMYKEYAALFPPPLPKPPITTRDEAFKKHSLIIFGERKKDGTYLNWPTAFGEDNGDPADGTGLMSGDIITQALDGIVKWLGRHGYPLEPGPVIPPGKDEEAMRSAENHVERARDLAAAQPAGAAAASPDARQQLIDSLWKALVCLDVVVEILPVGDPVRRLALVAATGLASIIGVLKEIPGQLTPHAFDALDAQDFRAFLKKHWASDTVINSGVVNAMYGLLFAYRDGDWNNQQMGAGTALRFIYRMIFTYRGAVFWKMQAGMGDVIFAPMYKVLEARGVKIELFHRVRNLGLSADHKSVERIELGRQAAVKGGGTYDPFVMVEKLPCWPAEPRYSQLVEGAELEAQHIDLESMWTPWVKNETPVTLENGKDFDVIIFAISIASIPYVAPELLAASARWKTMHDNIPTVRTQAAQLWLTQDTVTLGWTEGTAVADAFPEQLNTWADMTHLLAVEGWSGTGERPRNLTYFCAPMKGDIPPLTDPSAPAVEAAKVKANAIGWLTRYTNTIWPNATQPQTNQLNWDLLVDPQGRQGVARFDAQFWRANIDPSERYVLSVPGSTAFRIKATDRDFDNLFVTGDWTYTGVNAGCFEGTVMSGLLTINALRGVPLGTGVVGYELP